MPALSRVGMDHIPTFHNGHYATVVNNLTDVVITIC